MLHIYKKKKNRRNWCNQPENFAGHDWYPGHNLEHAIKSIITILRIQTRTCDRNWLYNSHFTGEKPNREKDKEVPGSRPRVSGCRYQKPVFRHTDWHSMTSAARSTRLGARNLDSKCVLFNRPRVYTVHTKSAAWRGTKILSILHTADSTAIITHTQDFSGVTSSRNNLVLTKENETIYLYFPFQRSKIKLLGLLYLGSPSYSYKIWSHTHNYFFIKLS